MSTKQFGTIGGYRAHGSCHILTFDGLFLMFLRLVYYLVPFPGGWKMHNVELENMETPNRLKPYGTHLDLHLKLTPTY